MNYTDVKNKARDNMKGFCRVCPECNGFACAGEVPGMGGSLTGSTFKSNVSDLKKVKLRMKTIHNAKKPDLSFNFFGNKLEIPILAAPITGSKFNMGGSLSEEDYLISVINGSLASGTLPMTGDSADPRLYEMGIDQLKKVNGRGIPIIKPKSNQTVKEYIKKAEASNVMAIGMDIDGAGLITMALNNAPVGPKTPEELKDIISTTNIPFILKGIMTVEEALIALEVGAKAIVVSNHGGRVLDHCQSTASVLPEIAKAVGGKLTIFVDGGIRTGVDVFKMLALGADGVLIGRPIIIGAFGGESEGVSLVLENMKTQLLQTMILTGAEDLGSINESMIIID